jgi:hypothetical protein
MLTKNNTWLATISGSNMIRKPPPSDERRKPVS